VAWRVTSRPCRRILCFLLAIGWSALGCAGRLAPLVGVATSKSLPAAVLAPGYRQVVFTWTLIDPNFGTTRGDGAAQIAPPDSARLDFFLAGGFVAGAAILIDDSLRLPGSDLIRHLIPPAAMLWAGFGRRVIPPAADTVIRVDGDTLWADFGRPVAWRVAFCGDTLVRLLHAADGRIVEGVERRGSGEVLYRNVPGHRTLTLQITRVVELSALDASIWHFPP